MDKKRKDPEASNSAFLHPFPRIHKSAATAATAVPRSGPPACLHNVSYTISRDATADEASIKRQRLSAVLKTRNVLAPEASEKHRRLAPALDDPEASRNVASTKPQREDTQDVETVGNHRPPPRIGAKTEHKCSFMNCSAVLPSSSELKRHFRGHTRPFCCTADECLECFPSLSGLKRHEKAAHRSLRRWKCPLCYMIYTTDVEQFARHLDTHPGLSPREYERHLANSTVTTGGRSSSHFWCGYCRVVVQNHSMGSTAHAFRFAHINMHVDNEERSWMNWVQEDGNVKGDIAMRLDPLKPST